MFDWATRSSKKRKSVQQFRGKSLQYRLPADHLGKCTALNSRHPANGRSQRVRQSRKKTKRQVAREMHRALCSASQSFLPLNQLYFHAFFHHDSFLFFTFRFFWLILWLVFGMYSNSFGSWFESISLQFGVYVWQIGSFNFISILNALISQLTIFQSTAMHLLILH